MPDPRRPYHLLRALLGPVLAPIYGLGQRFASRRFDRDPQSITRFDAPVVSIGNLSVGGTGKSPMVKLLAGMLQQQGCEVIVAMRGYKAHDGLSDEAADLIASIPGVTVLTGSDRTSNLRAHFRTRPINPSTIILLDDGFQHRQIARDLDIVLIDAAGPALQDRLLPWGDLRESVSALTRADVIVLTHADHAGSAKLAELQSALQTRFPRSTVLTAQHTWQRLEAFDLPSTRLSPAALPEDLDTFLSHRRGVVMTAIGQPSRFIEQIRRHLGPQGHLEELLFADHHAFTPTDVQRLLSALHQQASAEPPLLWTTSKDWVKLRPLLEGAYRSRSTLPAGTLMIVPQVTLTIEPLDTLINLLHHARTTHASRPH